MLKNTLIVTSLVALLSITATARGYGHQNHYGEQETKTKQFKKEHSQNRKNHGKSKRNQGKQDKKELLNNLTVGDLTDAQKEGLNYIIEEEKVARDVYTTLGKKWKTRVFSNIAKSEQRHMDAVGRLFANYDVETPNTLESVGIFENEELQRLYDDLIAKGNLSLIDALEVGVIVEETDIADLNELIASGIPSDFERVYSNLRRGSYKHLSAFNRQIAQQ